MKTSTFFISVLILGLVLSCDREAKTIKQIVIENTLDIDRSFETVSIDINTPEHMDTKGHLVIKEADTEVALITQEIDTDGDGKMDIILFQPKVPAKSKKVYEMTYSNTPKELEGSPACYSRFVPERTDDYAWENNRVAFRTYGPTAQKMKEEGIKGGTLSSGIDAWLKRVEYPIINKWYKKELETDGSYHKDDGEGLDNFHVGISRGVGGIAKKVDTTYYISKNFISWKTLSTGPIRTSFILTYADWDASGNKISDEKRISLDYGSNLSKFEITLKGTDTISAGLTLHEKNGEISINEENGWVSYWQPHKDSELGTGIVVPQNAMIAYEHFVTDRKDESNLFAHIEAKSDKAVYYAGFGWKKSGQFGNVTEWEAYLNRFAECLKYPLIVELK